MKCPDFLQEMSGILDTRIPTFCNSVWVLFFIQFKYKLHKHKNSSFKKIPAFVVELFTKWFRLSLIINFQWIFHIFTVIAMCLFCMYTNLMLAGKNDLVPLTKCINGEKTSIQPPSITHCNIYTKKLLSNLEIFGYYSKLISNDECVRQ